MSLGQQPPADYEFISGGFGFDPINLTGGEIVGQQRYPTAR